MEVDQKDSLGSHQEPCSSSSSSSPAFQLDPQRGLGCVADTETDSDHNKVVTCSKTKTLQVVLENDLKAADIKWSLFVAAAQSYKFDSCLKPFPPQFCVGELDRDIERLRNTICQVPQLPLLLEQLKNECHQTLPEEVIDLLHWALEEQEPKLALLTKEESEAVLQLAPSTMTTHKPTFVFKVRDKNNDTASVTRWQKMVTKYGVIHAYHGSRLENFHSILRYGLQQHMHKQGLFGSGIYLSSELGVSLPYSATGSGWSRSCLGSQLSCVALCHTINHPHVKCQQPGGTKEEIRKRALSKGSLGGLVPEKYFLVKNSDHVSVRYLLVYSKHLTPQTFTRLETQYTGTLAWIQRYKMILFVCAYILLLIAIGLGSSPNVRLVLRRAIRKLGL